MLHCRPQVFYTFLTFSVFQDYSCKCESADTEKQVCLLQISKEMLMLGNNVSLRNMSLKEFGFDPVPTLETPLVWMFYVVTSQTSIHSSFTCWFFLCHPFHHLSRVVSINSIAPGRHLSLTNHSISSLRPPWLVQGWTKELNPGWLRPMSFDVRTLFRKKDFLFPWELLN